MLYRCKVIFIIYMDDGIFTSPRDKAIERAITEIGSKFDIEDLETLDDYIGLNIKSLPDGKIKISQPHLIDQIVQDTNLMRRALPLSTPAKSRMILRRDISVPPFDHRFHYRSVVGKLNFHEKFT